MKTKEEILEELLKPILFDINYHTDKLEEAKVKLTLIKQDKK
jgi:hypothetical protein